MSAAADDVKSIFGQALERLDPASRAAYLAEACGENSSLRAEVEGLLAAMERAGDFLNRAPNPTDATLTHGDPASTGTYRPSPSTEAEGTVIAGRYKLRQQIGEGGMGTVWMADQTEPVKRKVAVKLIRVERGQSKTILARFEAERQAIALMDHPHIAKLLDAGTTETGAQFFIMELVKGIPLNEFCDQHRLTIQERLNLFQQICGAVQHAHQKGIIHRDLKPSNILVESHDGKPVPKVIDFGLAKATTGLRLSEQSMFTAFGSVMGTPLYMAPEQANFNAIDVDTRADVYALGVILYEMLTGTTPLTKETIKKAALDEMLKLIREQEAPTPSSRLSSADSLPSVSANRQIEPKKLGRFVKGELDWIVLKALSKERDRRYETANGFARDVERFLNHEPVQAGPVTAGYRIRKFVHRNRGQVIAASLVLLALLAGVVGTTWQAVAATRARDDLAAKNAELAEEQAKVQARFDMAIKAIETFHTGVSEDMLLKNPQFKELRTKLLKEAAVFYAEMEKLLAGQTDARSRRTLAEGYYQLGELTYKIGDHNESLAVHRKALAIRRELAAEGADVETRLDVARSLEKMGRILFQLGDNAGSLRAFDEQREIAAKLESIDPTDAVRFVHACGLRRFGVSLLDLGKHAEAMEEFRKALDILQRLVVAHPANADFLSELGMTHILMSFVLSNAGKVSEAMEASYKSVAIYQMAVAANPTNTELRQRLSGCHINLGFGLLDTGKLTQGREAMNNSLAIAQQLADDQPSVAEFQEDMAISYNSVGVYHSRTGNPAEALEAYRKGLPIIQKVAAANPGNTFQQMWLATLNNNIGLSLGRQKRFAEAFTAFGTGLAIRLKLFETDQKSTDFTEYLLSSYVFRGSIRVRAGQPAEAAADLRRALELSAKVPHLQSQFQFDRLRSQALLAGLGADAKSGVTKDEAKAFADQSVAALAALVKTGWALPSELMEPDFDAVRGRADFQKLFADVEAKAEKK